MQVSADSADTGNMRLLLAPALAAVTIAAAPQLTHGQLVARADGICVRYAMLLDSGVDGRLGDPDYDAEWQRLFGRQRAELGRLVPPTRDAVRYRAFLRTLPPIATNFASLAAALEDEQPVKKWKKLFHSLRESERAAGEAAQRVGLRRCFRANGRTVAR
jgi:hypothetical protein